MRERRWPATLRPMRKGIWDASDRARMHVARHSSERGPNGVTIHSGTVCPRVVTSQWMMDFLGAMDRISPAECETCSHPHVKGTKCSSMIRAISSDLTEHCGCTS